MTVLRQPNAMIVLALVAAAVAMRLPLMLLARPYNDELMYALVGHQWLMGHPPYSVLWDVKPPGLFALYAAAESMLGDPLLGPRVLPVICIVATALALRRLAIAWVGDGRAGFMAGLLYASYSLVLEGVMGSSELLVAPFVAFALLLAGRPGAWPALLSGFLFGLAGMVKQVAIFEAVLGFAIMYAANGERRSGFLAPASLYCLGGLTPFLAFAAYFGSVGTLDEFLQATVFSAALRTRGDGVSLLEGLQRFLPMLRPVLPLLVLCALCVTERRWFRDRRNPAHFTRVFAWFLAAAGGILVLRSMYDHYFLTLLPPLALGAGLFLAELQRQVSIFRRGAVLPAVIVALMAFPPAWVTVRAEWPIGDRDAAAITQRLAEHGLVGGTDEPELYVADHELALYLMTRTLQPTRFAYPQHLICDFPLPPGIKPEMELERVMARRPGYVVITTRRSRMICTREDRMALLGRHLEAEYELVARVGSEIDPVDIFRLRRGFR